MARSTTGLPGPGRGAGADGSSISKIMNGTLLALGQRGLRKLTMNDISEAACVSRGTLYRYFPTKEHALEALAEHVSLQFEEGVVRVARACSTPDDVLAAVMRFHFQVTEEQKATRLIEVEPRFVMEFLRSHHDRHVAALTEALRIVYDDIEARTGQVLDRTLCSALLVRLQTSTMIVPGREGWLKMPELLATFRSLLIRGTAEESADVPVANGGADAAPRSRARRGAMATARTA